MKLKPTDVVVIDAVRSPLGRRGDGCFRESRAERLSALVIDALLARNADLDPASVDELIWGCADQSAAQGKNMARRAALLSVLPMSVPALTVNRLEASSMTALHLAAQAILSGCGESFIVGGVEHMGHVQACRVLDLEPVLDRVTARAAASIGAVGELLAHTHAIDRQMQDRFALRSYQRAYQAAQQGRWDDELVPIAGLDEHGYPRLIRMDERIQEKLVPEQLAAYRATYRMDGGSVTVGNMSAPADGASALLLMSAERARAAALKPRARVRAMAVTACDPAVGGLGAVTAAEKLLDRSGLTLDDIDLFELHEQSAALVLAVLKELNLLDRLDDRINPCGGAIALGDPLGCSGARICTTLLHQMARQEAHLGLAMISVGMGQGVATLFERLN